MNAKHANLLAAALITILSSGCNVSKPSWNADAVKDALAGAGYTLRGERALVEELDEFERLSKVIELSLVTEGSQRPVMLRLYRFESAIAAGNSSFPVVQRYRKLGNYIQAGVRGKVAVIIEVDGASSAEADALLEVLKRI